MDTVGEALSEQRMRHAMSCLYATMVLSQANTLAIQEGRIGKIREKEMRGNPTAVSCMKDLAKWVDALKTFIEPVDLETSFLFPMKQSAALLQLMRNDMRRSTSVTGLVFAASDPVHDDITGRYLSTVSAIVPSMECAMCIRVEDWDGENKVGWYAFEGVQPIPLVNRMRPTSAFSIKTSKPEESIREMDFLKCSMSDVEVFRKSVAMENFCEVHSRQTQKRHMLGAPITLHGLVSRISANRVSLRGCGNGNESLTAYLSDGVCREFAERQMGRLEGKYVCALVAVWYWSDHDGNEKPEFEAYAIEEVNLDGAVAGDAVGFVRIRGRASVGDIQGMYGHLPESKSLVKKGDQVLFGVGGRGGRNPVHRKFSEAIDEIRNVRIKEGGSIHCFPKITPGIGNPDRQIRETLSDTTMRSIMLFIIKSVDGGRPVTKKQLGASFPNSFARRMSLLGSLRLVATTDGIITATRLGKKLAYACTAEYARYRMGSHVTPAVFLPDMDIGDIPPSFVFRHLEELGYMPVVVNQSKCKLVLRKDSASVHDIEACMSRVAAWRKNILDEFNAVTHPLTSAYLAERISKINSPVPAYVENVLNMMKNDGYVRQINGGSWEMPIEKKIMHVFSRSPKGVFTKEQIMERATIARISGDAVDETLHRLHVEGAVSKVLGDRWIVNGGAHLGMPAEEHPGVSRAIHRRMQDLSRRLLRGRRRHMAEQEFLGYLQRSLSDLGIRSNSCRNAGDAAARLVEDGTVTKHEGTYQLGSNGLPPR